MEPTSGQIDDWSKFLGESLTKVDIYPPFQDQQIIDAYAALGITIDNGRLVIKNNDGVNIMDGQGLISTANFPSGNVVDATSRHINSKTEADILNTTLPFSLNRQSRVLISSSIIVNLYNLLNTDAQIAVTVWVDIDGVDDANFMYMQAGPIVSNNAGSPVYETVSFTNTLVYNQIKTLDAGLHTIKMRWGMSAPYALTNNQGAITTNTSILYIGLGS